MTYTEDVLAGVAHAKHDARDVVKALVHVVLYVAQVAALGQQQAQFCVRQLEKRRKRLAFELSR